MHACYSVVFLPYRFQPFGGSLFFTNYHGDLTRIGKWMESDFGWRDPQPSIDAKLLISSNLQEAEILVIGDSFSDNLHWQTVLTQSGKKVASIHWESIGYICEDFQKKLNASGFKGNKIIVQAVERGAAKQFEKSVNCTLSKPVPFNTFRTIKPTDTSIQTEPAFNIKGQFIAGLETLLHSAAIRVSTHYSKIHNYKSKGTYILPIDDGCKYFSHRLCQYVLFFHEDFKRPALSEKTIEDIKTLKKRLNQYETMWVVVPNKSSIYDPKSSIKANSQFWKDIKHAGLGPNLYEQFNKNKSQIKDLFSPNDSHLSVNGFLLLGDIINQDL